jgi:hypothetical protein
MFFHILWDTRTVGLLFTLIKLFGQIIIAGVLKFMKYVTSLITCGNDTGDNLLPVSLTQWPAYRNKHKFANISANFCKKFEMAWKGILTGPEETESW